MSVMGEPYGDAMRAEVAARIEAREKLQRAADEARENLPPIVLISARDGVEVPDVPDAFKLGQLAESHGWMVRLTYALALVPRRWHENGNVKSDPYIVATVAVRMASLKRPAVGWACWANRDDAQGGFAFDCAFVNWQRFGWNRSFKKKRDPETKKLVNTEVLSRESIRERVRWEK